MKIVVDENIPIESVNELQVLRHDVIDVRGTGEQSADDQRLWCIAQERQALLISTDMGFVDYWREDHFGILLIRLRQPNRAKIHERILRAVKETPESDWPGLLMVMRDQTVNTRRRPTRGET